MSLLHKSSTKFEYVGEFINYSPINIDYAFSFLSYQIRADIVAGANNIESVSLTNYTFTRANHGFFTGAKGRLSTTGTLPAGLSAGVDYYVIVLNFNEFQIATSLANATATPAIPVTFTTIGSGALTFTGSTLTAGSVKLQFSNNYQWLGNGNISSTGDFFDAQTTETHTLVSDTFTTAKTTQLSAFNIPYRWARVVSQVTGATVKFTMWTKSI